jgi:cation:H+ antiporter
MLTVMALMTVPTLIRGKLSRWQGFLLLAIYFGYIATQFIFVKNVA